MVNSKVEEDDTTAKKGGHGRGGRYDDSRVCGGRHGSFGRNNSGYRQSRSDARMIQCNDGIHIELHPAYDFTPDAWSRQPEAENIRIIE